MLQECIEALQIKSNGIYVDCTAGGGGHSQHILEKLGKDGTLIDIDKDLDAIHTVTAKFKDFPNVKIVHSHFQQFQSVLNQLNVEKVDGVLIDLGVSSYQLDTAERGFSYMASDAPLDMRMNRQQELTAFDVVNGYSKEDLIYVLREYGEEKFASIIASNIIKARETEPISTCGQLVSIIDRSIPFKAQKQGSHNAKKTFQALRIEVNGELSGLKEVLQTIISHLNPNGRLVVLTFHSLEDRIVKHLFNFNATDCICDKSVPICVCGHKAEIKLINKKPITATEEEQKENSRSICAKLRIVEKL